MSELSRTKESMHEILQDSLTASPPLDGGLVVKWVFVMEVALPDSSHTLVRLSSDAGGRDLFRWEVSGLLNTAMEDHRP